MMYAHIYVGIYLPMSNPNIWKLTKNPNVNKFQIEQFVYLDLENCTMDEIDHTNHVSDRSP